MKTTSAIYSVFLAVLFLLLTNSCKKDDTNNPTSSGTVKDIDGNVYHTITIGTQVWMVENLKTTRYRNGDPIPNVTDKTLWGNLETGAYCYYNNDVTNGNKYGALYNRYAACGHHDIAPTGWHVADEFAWAKLDYYLYVNFGTSGSIAKAMAAKTDWQSSTEPGAIGNDLTKNNIFGFTALPAGRRTSDGVYYGLGGYSYWWSSADVADGRMVYYDGSDLLNLGSYLYMENSGMSVRCVKN